MKTHILSKILHWTLLLLTVTFLVSGLGISHFRIVETVTFGLLTKNVAFKIHEAIWIPFTVLLVIHLVLTLGRKRINRFRSTKDKTD